MTSRNELLTALRDAREGWLPLTGKVFTITLDPEERDMLIEALSARPEALRNPQDEAVRAAWDELLEKVAIQAVLPPKKGYDRRAIYLCVEDENDHGGEYVEVYDVSMEELNLLRGLLCAPSPLA